MKIPVSALKKGDEVKLLNSVFRVLSIEKVNRSGEFYYAISTIMPKTKAKYTFMKELNEVIEIEQLNEQTTQGESHHD